MLTGSEIAGSFPPYAFEGVRILENAGHEAWLVGGCVRDALIGRPFTDIDIASKAHWSQTKEAFVTAGWQVHETGTKHGTVTVSNGTNSIEITTYRSDGAYLDARHPESVTFLETIQEDLARRDFTMNAIAYHPERGLCDPFNGEADIADKTIRAVGEPHERFKEDALRVLRGCRFASQLGFEIEIPTYEAMVRSKRFLAKIASERITSEITQLLVGPHAGTAILSYVDALSYVLPELVAMKGFDQRSPYHIYDVLEHTCHVVDGVSPTPLLRWTALLHDCGKPAAFMTGPDGVGHFFGHGYTSCQLAKGALERFCLSPKFKHQVLLLIKHHDDTIELTRKAVKRAVAKMDNDPALFRALCEHKRGDARGQDVKFAHRIQYGYDLEAILDEILNSKDPLSTKDLAVNGTDLMRLGYKQGKQLGAVLSEMLEKVIEEELPNESNELLKFAASKLSEEDPSALQ